MKIILICLMFLMSCGGTYRVKGGTENTASGTVTQEYVLRVDVSNCMVLPEQDRLDCIKAITDALKEFVDAAKILLCAKAVEGKSGDESVDPIEQCRELILMEDGNSGT